MKSRLVKRGAEGAIALAYSHSDCGMVYVCKSPFSWEPQEEGMMSTAESFPQ
jgi:hypothetical protein